MPADSVPPDFSRSFPLIEAELACPACHGALHLEADHLICHACQRCYPIVDGIPILIADAAQNVR